jgi:hypothetical protein
MSLHQTLNTASQRRSTRRAPSPVRLEDEQANIYYHAQELLDLRHALAASTIVDSDEIEFDDTTSIYDASDEEQEDEKKEIISQWSDNIKDIIVPQFIAPTGKQHEARYATSPLSFLQLFLPYTLMNQFSEYTTSYAHTCGEEKSWCTTPEEVYAFISAHIFMGIVKLPKWHMYWSDNYQQPFVSSLFSQHRFEKLLRYFRVAPHTQPSHATNPLTEVQPLVTSLQHSFPRMYSPSQYLTLDEAMVAFKGRSSIKQYIPSKPHKWGYKIYCLASDNYLLHFEVYEGKATTPSSLGATYDTVMRMISSYEHQNYILFTDSWFTSPTVLSALKQNGVLACGSVRKNRKGLPIIPSEEVNNLNKGEWTQRQQGDMNLVIWKDQKDLWLLYNHTSPLATSTLKRWNDFGKKVNIGCPKAVHDYFFNSRSVDVSGQLHYGYLPGRKSKRSWWRLVWWLIDMCIVNAYILHQIDHDGLSQLSFREALMYDLVKPFISNRNAVQSSRGANKPITLASEHYSEHSHSKRDCLYCSKHAQKRVQTVYCCHTCRVHLCIGECFAMYHSKQ